MLNKDHISFLETVLDSMREGVYVVDEKGNFILVNSSFVKMVGLSRQEILEDNVYGMLNKGYLSQSVSDIVYKTKRRVTMFQDVHIDGKQKYRQLITSTPIFDSAGKVTNIVAITKPLYMLNQEYQEATLNDAMELNFTLKDSNPLEVIYSSDEMGQVLAAASTAANADSAILVQGESGVGKEVVVRYIHNQSNRCYKDLVEINCASLPETLLEAELFGYEKGAFTGALQTGKKGIIEEADGGTLFLDEINSLPFALQGKLLRVLESKMVQRIGSTKAKYVDFRLITATNQDLAQCVKEGRFRMDLYYRLHVIPLYIPPLRERKNDILPLCLHFLKQYCQKYNRVKSFSKNVYQVLEQYSWPGNVRELKNFVERMVVMSAQEVIEINDISEDILTGNTLFQPSSEKKLSFDESDMEPEPETDLELSLKDYLDYCEKKYIEKALKKHKSTYKAAKALQVSQSTIVRRKEKHHIQY